MSLNSHIPEMCQLHARNSLIPQLGYVLGGRETSPGSDCDSALHVQELSSWWLPGADGCPVFMPQTSPVCCTFSCCGLVCPAASGLSSSGGPAHPGPTASLFTASYLSGVQSCLSQVTRLCQPCGPPHPEKKIAPAFQPARGCLRWHPDLRSRAHVVSQFYSPEAGSQTRVLLGVVYLGV